MSLSPALTGVASAYPLPNTTPTPAVGEQVKASDVQLAAQGLLNQDMALQTQVNLKAPKASPTFTGTVTAAAVHVTGNATVDGVFGVTGTSTLGGNSTASGAHGIALDGTAPAATADPGGNNLAIGALQCKAWGNVSFVTTALLADAINVASVTITASVTCTVVFARPMANLAYSVVYGATDPHDLPVTTGKTPNGFTFSLFDPYGSTSPVTLSSGIHSADFHVMARQ